MRVGCGYDVHRLVEGRKLVLGGVLIPFEMGLLGHSDADVLIHAVMDALLGAAGISDIGVHFPDTNESFKDADSTALLAHVGGLLRSNSYQIVNIDSVIIAEKPKLSPFFGEMKANIAGALNIAPHDVNVKATTEEGLGFTGSGLGMAAKATALIERSS